MQLRPDQIDAFHRDGFVILEGFLSDAEVGLLSRVAHADRSIQESAVARKDGQGGTIRLEVRNSLCDDIYSAIVRSERVVRAMEVLLGGEVYHYHHKLILKDARTGGAWEWHQDYGYWYANGCLFPDMASCLIAIDPATRENGCLQVLRGSHKMGRLDHGPVGDQTGADPERVAAASERLELVSVELAPGSAVIFHGNTLHRSDANTSERNRWAFICCYNRASNDPYKESRHPRYSPLEIWPDERILEIGHRDLVHIEHEVPTGP